MNVGEYNTLDLVKDNTKKKNVHICLKYCTKTAQMCLIGLLIHFQVHNWALSSNNNMPVSDTRCEWRRRAVSMVVT